MNRMKNKKYHHTVGTVPKYKRKITGTVAKSTLANTYLTAKFPGLVQELQ